ncbi:hypothetical protein WSM22_31460 [Cytophagales bacterium WSM2-2]|nr:hypothetical protein WSM22_31460 [Cytophagales bacterium WSM2-2]
MQLNIIQKGSSLSVNIDDKPTLGLSFQEYILSNNWKILSAGREFGSIKKKGVRFFSSDANVEVSTKSTNGSEVLHLRYINKRPHILFEHNGSSFQIVFHKLNRFSYFHGDTQFARTDLKVHMFKDFHYDSLVNEQVIDPQIFLLSQLGLIYLNSVSGTDEAGLSVVVYRSFPYGEFKPMDEGWI